MHLKDHAEALEQEFKGNWKKFDSFAWHDMPDDPDNWGIYYTRNRDSGLIEEANANTAAVILDPFLLDPGDEGETVREEHHGHWACGWIDGFAVKVRGNDGEFTPAFLELTSIVCTIRDSILLSDEEYSRLEYEAAVAAIENEASSLLREPEGWASDVFGWLRECCPEEVESRDDQGAMPSQEVICQALIGLGIGFECPHCDVIIQKGTATENHLNNCEWA